MIEACQAAKLPYSRKVWNAALRYPGPCCAAATVAHGKAQMKRWLQERLGLAVDPAAPLIGFVGRLTMQKGVDVLLGAAPALLARSATLPAPSRWRPEMPETDAAVERCPAAQQPGMERQVGSCSGSSDAAAVAPLGHRVSWCTESCLPPVAPLCHSAASHVAVCNASQISQLTMPAGQPAEATAKPAMQLVLLGTGEVWGPAAVVCLLRVHAGGCAACHDMVEHASMAARVMVMQSHVLCCSTAVCQHLRLLPGLLSPFHIAALDGICTVGPVAIVSLLRRWAHHLFRFVGAGLHLRRECASAAATKQPASQHFYMALTGQPSGSPHAGHPIRQHWSAPAAACLPQRSWLTGSWRARTLWLCRPALSRAAWWHRQACDTAPCPL